MSAHRHSASAHGSLQVLVFIACFATVTCMLGSSWVVVSTKTNDDQVFFSTFIPSTRVYCGLFDCVETLFGGNQVTMKYGDIHNVGARGWKGFQQGHADSNAFMRVSVAATVTLWLLFATLLSLGCALYFLVYGWGCPGGAGAHTRDIFLALAAFQHGKLCAYRLLLVGAVNIFVACALWPIGIMHAKANPPFSRTVSLHVGWSYILCLSTSALICFCAFIVNPKTGMTSSDAEEKRTSLSASVRSYGSVSSRGVTYEFPTSSFNTTVSRPSTAREEREEFLREGPYECLTDEPYDRVSFEAPTSWSTTPSAACATAGGDDGDGAAGEAMYDRGLHSSTEYLPVDLDI